MTFDEIAQREGVSPQGAREIYLRAIQKLRRAHRQREFVHLVILYRARVARPERLTAA
ncbi:MAG: hypothetical protein ABSE36_11850 [Terracidiphilus sp.]